MIFRDDEERGFWVNVYVEALNGSPDYPHRQADAAVVRLREREAKPTEDSTVMDQRQYAEPGPICYMPPQPEAPVPRSEPAMPYPDAESEHERLEKLRVSLWSNVRPPAPGWTPGMTRSEIDRAINLAIAAIPPAPAPRSERAALERVKAWARMEALKAEDGRRLLPLWKLYNRIDAELSRQPPDDTREVEAVIGAARVVASKQNYASDLRRALADLDRKRGGE